MKLNMLDTIKQIHVMARDCNDDQEALSNCMAGIEQLLDDATEENQGFHDIDAILECGCVVNFHYFPLADQRCADCGHDHHVNPQNCQSLITSDVGHKVINGITTWIDGKCHCKRHTTKEPVQVREVNRCDDCEEALTRFGAYRESLEVIKGEWPPQG